MFAVTISVFFLVVFVSNSQVSGLNSSASSSPSSSSSSPSSVIVTATANPPQTVTAVPTTIMSTMVTLSQTSTSETISWDPPSSTTIAPSSSASVTPPEKPTCVKLGVTLDLPWDKDYKNESSERYKNISRAFVSALKMLYNDTARDKDMWVSEVEFENKEDKVFVEGILCLVFVGDEVIIVVEFRNKVATGKLSDNLKVLKDSAEVEPQGVTFTKWEAKEGECDNCEGAAGPFEIERGCEQGQYSCKGQEITKETKDCTTYCSATVAVTVSSVILAIGIFLSYSFQ